MIPTFNDPYTKCKTQERLHTSFLKFNQPQALHEALVSTKAKYFDWNPFTPIMFKDSQGWMRFDALANLYATIKESCHVFTEAELSSYDHLFCGSHIDLVIADIAESFPWVSKVHAEVKNGNHEVMRGIWKKQEAFFSSS